MVARLRSHDSGASAAPENRARQERVGDGQNRHAVIEARATLSHPPEQVFAFLSDLRNHWRLDDAFVEVGGVEGNDGQEPTGGRVRIRGPVGLSREARTKVLSADPPGPATPGMLSGRADVGGATIGRVGWEIAGRADGGSDVRLWAEVERASLLDRLLLALGGRRWLRRILERTVVNLAEALE